MRSQHIALLAAFVILFAGMPGVTTGQGAPPQQMPPGHPPLGGQAPSPSLPDVPKGSGTGGQAITWTVPPAWSQETPSSSMRRAQYRIKGPGGPAECVVFYFGPGQGGDAKANADRWASQFKRPDGSAADKDLKTRQLKVAGMPVLMVEVTGTYVGGMGGGPAGPERPKSMLLGAIIEGPDANWFFRAIGPRSTLERERAAFEKMVKSIKRGQGRA